MKMLLRSIGLAVVHKIGMKIFDSESGRPLGRVLLIPWGGKVRVVGLERSVRPVFLLQTRLTYWKQDLGFTTHPPPDFPSLERSQKPGTTDSRQ
jgi:hypothetical protein